MKACKSLKPRNLYDKIISIFPGETHRSIAEKVGVSEHLIGKWKSNVSFPSIDVLDKIAEIKGFSKDWWRDENLSSKSIDKIFQKNIVNRIETLCADRGMAKKELARRCDFSLAVFSTWKSCKHEITEESLQKLAVGLGVTVEHLKGEPERLTANQTSVTQQLSELINRASFAQQRVLSDPVLADRIVAEKRLGTLVKSFEWQEVQDKSCS